MNNEKHLFFDLDRTLWDFEKNSQQALKHLFVELKVEEYIKNFYDFLHAYKRINNELWVKYGKGKIGKDELRAVRFHKCLEKFGVNNENLANQLSDGYIEISPNQTNIFPKTHETLQTLKNDNFNLHIITNGFKEVQFRKLANCNLRDYFDVIVCSEEIGKTKPSPDVFNYAMNKAQATPINSVMIGDDLHVDVLGASNAGMHAVLFDPENNRRRKKDRNQIQSLDEIPELLPWIFRSHLN